MASVPHPTERPIMTNHTPHGQVPDALRIADEFKLCSEYDSIPSIIDIEKAEAELRRLHAENVTLQQGYNAARLEIDSLQARVQELGTAPTPTKEQQAAPKASPATQQAGEKCPSCRNGDLYACTCPFPTSRNATTAHAAESVPAREHDLQDVLCGCCGYMTYHREHMGCIRAARAPAESVQRDAERLDWLEQHSQVNIERVRYLGSDESVYEVTPYNSADYDGKTLRAAIDAAIAAHGGTP